MGKVAANGGAGVLGGGYVLNANFEEDKHKRADDGKFSAGGTGGGTSTAQKTDITEVLGKEHVGVKGQTAIDTLLREKSGHVKGAFHRDDIGGIDLAWGDDKFGMQHIIKQREAQGIDSGQFLSNLGEVIDKGTSSLNKKGNYELLYKGRIAVVTQTFQGDSMQLLLTAYKTRQK